MIEHYIVVSLVMLLAVAAWAGVFYALPWSMQAILRHRLWAIRDGLYDDIRVGRLPNNPATCGFLRSIEAGINHASDLSFFNLLTLGFFHGVGNVAIPESVRQALREMTPEQRSALEGYQSDVGRVLIRHVFLATPSGWFGSAVALIALLGMLVFVPRRLSEAWRDAQRSAGVNLHRQSDAMRWRGDEPGSPLTAATG